MTVPPFVSDVSLEAALIQLEADRPAYSIDEWFGQMGIEPDDVPDALRDEAVRAAGDLSCLVVDGRIPVFREIVAPYDWNHASEDRPHLFWAHSADLAHAHWGEGSGVRWLLSGSVAAEDVDEPTTIALNANPMLSEEGEIRLLSGRSVLITSVERRPEGHRHRSL
jgi:hypothetical protein